MWSNHDSRTLSNLLLERMKTNAILTKIEKDLAAGVTALNTIADELKPVPPVETGGKLVLGKPVSQ